MNWDAIGAIGQVLGSIAVFVTLVYLAIQVRHAREQSRRALSQARSEALRQILALQCDERVNRIRVKAESALGEVPGFGAFMTAMMERTGLTHEEALVMALVQASLWNYRLQIIPDVDELSPIDRTQFNVAIRTFYVNPGIGQVF